MATLGDIERLTREFADARERLSGTVRTLEDRIEALKRQYLPGIRKQVGLAREKKSVLAAAIGDSPELFVKPRTVVISGIKIGFEKGKGSLGWESDEVVVKLIRKHFPGDADILIKTKETPLKKALSALSVADLKKIGVTVEETGDVVVIRPTDSEVDKLVDALLKDIDETGAEEAA